MGCQAEIMRHHRQRFPVDERRTQTAQLTFLRVWETFEKRFRNHQIEHGITEEFQPFVVVFPRAAMSKRGR